MKMLKAILKGDIYSIYLFAFLIPLNPKWYGYCLLLIVLESILKINKFKKISILSLINIKNPFIWLVFFYLFHVIGLLNTSNFEFAKMDLGMKSTFLILPLYFTLVRPQLDLTKLFKLFLYGCLFSLVLYGINGALTYFESGTVLKGSNFSFWMHRGYYAIYLVLAFTFLYTEAIRKNKLTVINIVFLLLLFSGTIITESKAGILIILVNAFLLFFYFLKVKIGWLKSGVIMLVLFLITTFVVSNVISSNNRFSGALYNFNKEKIDITSTESTTARILMWETSIDIIQNHIILGVGTGDVKDELQKLNYEKGYTGVAESNLNAHNQFLNSWVALGIFGFISLMGVFITLFMLKDSKYKLYVRFISFSLFLMFLTESFLEVQAGIIPFAFLVSSIGARTEMVVKNDHENQ